MLWIVCAAVGMLGILWYYWRQSIEAPAPVPVSRDELRQKRLAALERASSAAVVSNPQECAENVVPSEVENETLRQRRGATASKDTTKPTSAAEATPSVSSSARATSSPHAASASPPKATEACVAPEVTEAPDSPGGSSSPKTAKEEAECDKSTLHTASTFDLDDLYGHVAAVGSTATAPVTFAKKVTGPLQLAGDIRMSIDVADGITVNELRRLVASSCPEGHYVRLFHQGRELRGDQKVFDNLKNSSLMCRMAVGCYTISHHGASLKVKAIPGDSVQVAGQAVRRAWGVPIAMQKFSCHKGPVDDLLGEELSLNAEFTNDTCQHVYRWVNSITINGSHICTPNPLPATTLTWSFRDGSLSDEQPIAVEEMSIAAAKVRCQQLHAAAFSFQLTDNGEPDGRLLGEEEARTIYFQADADGFVEPDVIWGTWVSEEVEIAVKDHVPIVTEVERSDGYILQINFAEKNRQQQLDDAMRISLLHVDIRIFSVSSVDRQLRKEEEVAYERIVMPDDNAVTLAVSESELKPGHYVVLFPNSTVPFEGPMVTMILHVGDEEQKAKYRWATSAAFEFFVN